ncbi:hypothetical protein NMY22_g7322 [Coprinellus aureogranulatus]|nr:hypothetical protein NMY22_g7322 [Coprinellus aureogranulatus]
MPTPTTANSAHTFTLVIRPSQGAPSKAGCQALIASVCEELRRIVSVLSARIKVTKNVSGKLEVIERLPPCTTGVIRQSNGDSKHRPQKYVGRSRRESFWYWEVDENGKQRYITVREEGVRVLDADAHAILQALQSDMAFLERNQRAVLLDEVEIAVHRFLGDGTSSGAVPAHLLTIRGVGLGFIKNYRKAHPLLPDGNGGDLYNPSPFLRSLAI